MMTAGDRLHYLLQIGFRDMRGRAVTQRELFWLADVAGELMPRLAMAARGETAFDDVLAWLRDRAERDGRGDWLEGRLKSWARSGRPPAEAERSMMLLYRGLYMAVFAFDVEAKWNDDEDLFRVARLFRVTPYVLLDVLLTVGIASYDRALLHLREHAKELGLEQWLTEAEREAEGSLGA